MGWRAIVSFLYIEYDYILIENDAEKLPLSSIEHTQPLPAQVREELKQYVFMPTGEQRNWVDRPEKSPIEWRKFIRRKLRKMAQITDADIDFIKENPEHAEWLKAHVRPRFWDKFQALTEERERVLAMERSKVNADSGSEQEDTVTIESEAKSLSPDRG